jgi:DNA-binding transcriptional LysR family regulator
MARGATGGVTSRDKQDARSADAGIPGRFRPRIAHEIDSLELVEDLIIAGYGVGLLPIGRPTSAGVKVLELSEPKAVLTAYAVTRRGRATWPPLRTVLDRMRPARGSELPRPKWPRPVPGR